MSRKLIYHTIHKNEITIFVIIIISSLLLLRHVQHKWSILRGHFPCTALVSLCLMIFGKIADCIWMLFGVVAPRMCSVGRGADHLMVRGNLGGGYEVAHCDQWGICGLAV